MGDSIFISDLCEAEVARILSASQVNKRLGDRIGADMQVTLLGEKTYRVTGTEGDFVVRFPRDEAHLAMLKKEESIQSGLRDKITVLIPDTSVIDDADGCPAFAIHTMIPGQPLTSDGYACLSPEARDRLIMGLVNFFYETHRISLGVACEWLGIPFEGQRTVVKLASTWGKPVWFGPHAVAEMRISLAPFLDVYQMELFENTVELFEALGTDADYMIFGHGDMHGFNMAIGEDHVGPKFIGAFDLGCAGVLDVHEDFFRLSLVSEDLLDRVIETYHLLPDQTRSLQRDRIAIYYRAFLFYLMAEKSGQGLGHLKTLLKVHVEYHGEKYTF